jgi:2-methylisocitrate lyase-like PEP mutase family enzyme
MTTRSDRLRALLSPQARAGGLLHLPGCWDGLTALMIEKAGFEAAFLSGSALAMGRFGLPDLGLITVTELAEAVRAITDRVAIPLLVDADTGFGNALNMARTVRTLERAGAAALQIEDQGFPKRCGHMAGKTVIPASEMVGKIKAALDARGDALIVARTDALAIEGIDAAIDRAEAYLEAGADALFVEGPRDAEGAHLIGERFGHRVPLVHNLVEGGVGADISAGELAAMGFAAALHPLLLLHGFARAAPGWLAHLAEHRGTAGLGDAILDLAGANALVGAADYVKLGESYDG